MEGLARKSFGNGWKQVPVGLADIVKAELSNALSIGNNMMWNRRLKGEGCSALSNAEIAAVEGIFGKYGIVNDIWLSNEGGECE